jgi:hypothetical protein
MQKPVCQAAQRDPERAIEAIRRSVGGDESVPRHRRERGRQVQRRARPLLLLDQPQAPCQNEQHAGFARQPRQSQNRVELCGSPIVARIEGEGHAKRRQTHVHRHPIRGDDRGRSDEECGAPGGTVSVRLGQPAQPERPREEEQQDHGAIGPVDQLRPPQGQQVR